MPGPDELAARLAEVSARLKEIGDGGLTRELSKAIGRAVQPVPAHIRAGLRPRLPDRYADELDATLNIFRRSFTSPDQVQVSIYATNTGPKRRKLRRLDGGVLWHPLFGDRKEWREQGAPSVRPGWFSGPVREAAPQVREEIRKAVSDVARKAAGEP